MNQFVSWFCLVLFSFVFIVLLRTDIAVGAPFADSGIVYIYHGRRRGIRQAPAQVRQ